MLWRAQPQWRRRLAAKRDAMERGVQVGRKHGDHEEPQTDAREPARAGHEQSDRARNLENSGQIEVRDEQLVKALCYGFLPAERALARLQEVKASHAQKLEMYEGFERELKAQLREGTISREAYLGTLLTIRRGIGSEKSYLEWCDEAAQVTASVAPSHSTSEPERSSR